MVNPSLNRERPVGYHLQEMGDIDDNSTDYRGMAGIGATGSVDRQPLYRQYVTPAAVLRAGDGSGTIGYWR